jgi:hypothetical protein
MGAKPYKKLTLFGCAVTISALTACSNSKWQEVAPKTGDPIAEQQKAPSTPPLKHGDEVVVVTDRLPGRDRPDQPLEETEITLERGDKVKVTDPNPKGKEGFVEVVVVDTRAPHRPEKPILLPREYVAPEQPPKTQEQDQADRYFMIQNVATEKSRIYENCVEKKSDGTCVHRLVLESEMTAGEDTPQKDRRTLLGSFRITQWYKFYQDKQDLFPSFYAPGYPKLPDEGASVQTWLSKKYLPEGKGQMRGAFGWYTAHLGPNAEEQWTHGTFGWGDDGDKFILVTREPKYSHLRSAGCTRVENQAIAFAREVLAKGAKVIRIYAKEGYRDETLARYKTLPLLKWKWILTKEGINSPLAPTASAAKVSKKNPTDNDILDAGTFPLNHVPQAAEGNLYSVPQTELKGAFLVDEGRLVGYEHPKSLRVGGHADRKLPSLVLSNDTSYTLARKKSKTEVLKPSEGKAGPQPQQK